MSAYDIINAASLADNEKMIDAINTCIDQKYNSNPDVQEFKNKIEILTNFVKNSDASEH